MCLNPRQSTITSSYGLSGKSTASSIGNWTSLPNPPSCPSASSTYLDLRISAETGQNISARTLWGKHVDVISRLHRAASSSSSSTSPTRSCSSSSWDTSSSRNRRSTGGKTSPGLTSDFATIRKSWTSWRWNPVTCWLWLTRRASFQRSVPLTESQIQMEPGRIKVFVVHRVLT